MSTADETKAIPLPDGVEPQYFDLAGAEAMLRRGVRGPTMICVHIEEGAPVAAWMDEFGDVVVVFPPEATASEVQAAVWPVYPMIVREIPATEPTKRRPGPPPRAETARERSARWRREGR